VTDPRKIGFRLERDEDGYPPPGSEWLWAYPSEGMWVIDNIPWYSPEVSLGDAVEAQEDEEGQLWFRKTGKPSGHSTLRVLVQDRDSSRTAALRTRLEALGCSSEQWSAERPFLAVDVPPEVEIRAVVEVLAEGESQGAWGWETGLLGNGHRSRWPAS